MLLYDYFYEAKRLWTFPQNEEETAIDENLARIRTLILDANMILAIETLDLMIPAVETHDLERTFWCYILRSYIYNLLASLGKKESKGQHLDLAAKDLMKATTLNSKLASEISDQQTAIRELVLGVNDFLRAYNRPINFDILHRGAWSIFRVNRFLKNGQLDETFRLASMELMLQPLNHFLYCSRAISLAFKANQTNDKMGYIAAIKDITEAIKIAPSLKSLNALRANYYFSRMQFYYKINCVEEMRDDFWRMLYAARQYKEDNVCFKEYLMKVAADKELILAFKVEILSLKSKKGFEYYNKKIKSLDDKLNKLKDISEEKPIKSLDEMAEDKIKKKVEGPVSKEQEALIIEAKVRADQKKKEKRERQKQKKEAERQLIKDHQEKERSESENVLELQRQEVELMSQEDFLASTLHKEKKAEALEPEEPKAEEPKAEESIAEELKVEELKVEETIAELPKTEKQSYSGKKAARKRAAKQRAAEQKAVEEKAEEKAEERTEEKAEEEKIAEEQIIEQQPRSQLALAEASSKEAQLREEEKILDQALGTIMPPLTLLDLGKRILALPGRLAKRLVLYGGSARHEDLGFPSTEGDFDMQTALPLKALAPLIKEVFKLDWEPEEKYGLLQESFKFYDKAGQRRQGFFSIRQSPYLADETLSYTQALRQAAAETDFIPNAFMATFTKRSSFCSRYYPLNNWELYFAKSLVEAEKQWQLTQASAGLSPVLLSLTGNALFLVSEEKNHRVYFKVKGQLVHLRAQPNVALSQLVSLQHEDLAFLVPNEPGRINWTPNNQALIKRLFSFISSQLEARSLGSLDQLKAGLVPRMRLLPNIETVRNSLLSLAEDPVRQLRLVYFTNRLGYQFYSTHMIRVIAQHSNLFKQWVLDHPGKAQAWMTKLFCKEGKPKLEDIVFDLQSLGLLDLIFPGLGPAYRADQQASNSLNRVLREASFHDYLSLSYIYSHFIACIALHSSESIFSILLRIPLFNLAFQSLTVDDYIAVSFNQQIHIRKEFAAKAAANRPHGSWQPHFFQATAEPFEPARCLEDLSFHAPGIR